MSVSSATAPKPQPAPASAPAAAIQAPATAKPATTAPAAPDSTRTPPTLVNTPQGRVYTGPVHVQNRIELQARAKIAIEDIAAEVTVIGADLKKKQIYSEGKLMRKASAVDGNDTGIRAGLADNGKRLGNTSPTMAARPIAAANDALGIHNFFIGLQSFTKVDSGVYQNKVVWKGTGTKVETFDKVRKNGVKLMATGDADIAGARYKGTVDALEIGREKKGSTGTYQTIVKSTVKGMVVATDQYTLPEKNQKDRRVLPDGKSVNVATPQGLAAYEAYSRAGSKSGDLTFHFQQADAGASNVAIDVPDMRKVLGADALTATSKSGRTTNVVDSHDPTRTVMLEKTSTSGKTTRYVPVDALVSFVQAKAKADPKSYGDFAGIKVEDVLKANEGRTIDIKVPDGKGGSRKVKAFDEADTVNLGYATVQGVQGVVRAPNLKEYTLRADFELFFSHAKGTAAGAIAPSSIKPDGTVDKKQVAHRVAVDVTNGVGETAFQFIPALVEGGLRLGSAAVSGMSRFGARADQYLIDNIKANRWDQTSVGKGAVSFLEKDKKAQELDDIAKHLDEAADYVGKGTKAAGEFYYKNFGGDIEKELYGGKYDAKAIEKTIATTFAPQRDAIAANLRAGKISQVEAEKQYDALKVKISTAHRNHLEEAAFDPRYADAHPVKGLVDKPISQLAAAMPAPAPQAPPAKSNAAALPTGTETRIIRNGDTLWDFWKEHKTALNWQDYRDAVSAHNPQAVAAGKFKPGQRVVLPTGR